MRLARILLCLVLLAGAAVVAAAPAVPSVPSAPGAAGPGRCLGDPGQQPGWALSTTTFDPGYTSHAFVGNGYLSQRVPPAGTGYAATGEQSGWPLFTPRYDGAFVTGLYGADPQLLEGRHVAAALPTWSTLSVDVGSDSFTAATPAGRISGYRQTLYLGCGVLRTTLTWTSADGHATDLEYEVLADQADPHVGVVRLVVTPRWSGDLGVTDLIDGAGARRLEPAPDRPAEPAGTIAVPFRTQGTGVAGAVVSTLRAGPGVSGARLTAVPADGLTRGQRLTLPVRAGRSYEFTKYVGVDTALTSADPAATAFRASTAAAARGWPAVLDEQVGAWRQLWHSDVQVPGDPRLQSWLRSGMYGLLSSVRAGEDDSISPTGLSSDNYAGLVFWDADTWMYPGLLLQHPDITRSIVDYRSKLLPAARSNAERIGQQGAFYSWTSADSGDLWQDCESWGPPPHCLIQDHLQSDIALSVWQYYAETGDLDWLRREGWPLLRGLAEYWAGRVTANADGSYSIRDIAGPDEYSNDVDDGVFTNAGAATALRTAIQAAALLGQQVPGSWQTIADHLRIPYDPRTQVFQQYAGYQGTTIKQADSVLLQYPLEWPMSTQAAAATLDYYAQRTDPDGPAMTDAIHAIDSAQIGAPGCATHTYLERASEPFIRDPFAQFSEARGTQAGQGAGALALRLPHRSRWSAPGVHERAHRAAAAHGRGGARPDAATAAGAGRDPDRTALAGPDVRRHGRAPHHDGDAARWCSVHGARAGRCAPGQRCRAAAADHPQAGSDAHRRPGALPHGHRQFGRTRHVRRGRGGWQHRDGLVTGRRLGRADRGPGPRHDGCHGQSTVE